MDVQEMTVDSIRYYEFFDFRLDVENQKLLKAGNNIPLTHKAFQVLQLLVANAGRTTSKAEIFEQLWRGSFVEDGNLTQHIHVLRKVLGHTPDGRSYVETVPRFGYRFALNRHEISVVFEGDESTDTDYFAPVAPVHPGRFRRLVVSVTPLFSRMADRVSRRSRFAPVAEDTHSAPKRRTAVRKMFLIAGMFVTAETVVTPTYNHSKSSAMQQPQPSPIKSIAVMPFKPIGEKVDKEKLGVGMTDAVITNLSKAKQVSVRSTSAVSRYVNAPATDASAAGRDLRVDGVLEGMVQSDGESLRVSVQLIRVEDGKPMWAESFREKVSDNFTMQDSISSKVAQSLSNNLAQPDIVARSPFSDTPASEGGETNE